MQFGIRFQKVYYQVQSKKSDFFYFLYKWAKKQLITVKLYSIDLYLYKKDNSVL